MFINRLKKPNRKIIVAGSIVLVIALVVLGLELTNTTYLLHKRKAVSGPIPATIQTDNSMQEPDNESTPDTSESSSSNIESSEKTNISPVSGAELLSPSGSLVSNHRPSLKKTSNEESVCITTPGAMCSIAFRMGNVVKTLEEKKADSSGAVIWSWDVGKAGFTVGSWSITATASLGGSSKSTTDLQNLEVQP